MFSELPERALGMNSTRISAVLNHRVSLPRLVSLGHIHAVTNAPTTTERELAKLVRNGLVRRISVPGRGRSGSGGTDMVVLVEDVERMLARPSQLTDEIKRRCLRAFCSVQVKLTALKKSIWNCFVPILARSPKGPGVIHSQKNSWGC